MSCHTILRNFHPLTLSDMKAIIDFLPSKTCEFDHFLTSMVKQCSNLLLPAILHIVNLPLINGIFPEVLKQACVTPSLKNKMLDVDDVCSYRPVSNLPFLSKVKKCVHIQIDMYLCENFLYGEFQSVYRSGFSCETAPVKISNDILSLLDTKSNAVLLLFDLIAVFDTVNHNLLLTKLFENFGFADNAFKWFSTYLEKEAIMLKVLMIECRMLLK